jgi:hypothetical protein
MVCGPRWVLFLSLSLKRKKKRDKLKCVACVFKVSRTAEAICSMDHLDLESPRSFRHSLVRCRMIYAC